GRDVSDADNRVLPCPDAARDSALPRKTPQVRDSDHLHRGGSRHTLWRSRYADGVRRTDDWALFAEHRHRVGCRTQKTRKNRLGFIDWGTRRPLVLTDAFAAPLEVQSDEDLASLPGAHDSMSRVGRYGGRADVDDGFRRTDASFTPDIRRRRRPLVRADCR